VKVLGGFGGIRLPQANNAATEHTLRASLHFKKVPKKNPFSKVPHKNRVFASPRPYGRAGRVVAPDGYR